MPEKDYASVIESLTDERREDDFQTDQPYNSRYNTNTNQHQSSNNNDTVRLSLKQVNEEEEDNRKSESKEPLPSTTQMYPAEFESGSDTARLSVDSDRSPHAKPEDEYMDGFKVSYRNSYYQ